MSVQQTERSRGQVRWMSADRGRARFLQFFEAAITPKHPYGLHAMPFCPHHIMHTVADHAGLVHIELLNIQNVLRA